MADLNQIADLVSQGVKGPSGPDDAGYHTGIVLTWNSLTGANTINVNDVVLQNLRPLRAGIGVSYNPGDTVVVLRKQTQYFVMGRVSSVAGGGSSGIQFASKLDSQNIGDTGSGSAIPSCSVTVQTYLPSSSRCLMIMTVGITLYSYTVAFAWPRVTLSTGAVITEGTIDAMGDFASLFTGTPSTADSVDTTITVLYVTNPADGFVPGLTTFQVVVGVDDASSPPTGVDFHRSSLTLIPL